MEKVKVGCVGTGGMANSHLSKLATLENAEIVALCDISEERVSSAVATYGGVTYTNAKKMINETDLDAVYFCLPPFAHSEIEKVAAENGLHIFVEKPVAMDLDHGLSVVEATNKSGVISGVGYQGRYQNAENALKEFLTDKTIGMIACHRWGGIAGGPEHWWRVMAKSGGMLHEQATHQIDMIRYLAGEITEVYKIDSMRVNIDQENNTIPDAEVVTLQFENGAVGYITTTSALVRGGGSMRTDFILEDHIVLQLSWGNFTIVPEGVVTVDVPDTPQVSVDEAFINAIQANDQSIVKSSYADGLRSALVSICANQSAIEGKPIQIPTVP